MMLRGLSSRLGQVRANSGAQSATRPVPALLQHRSSLASALLGGVSAPLLPGRPLLSSSSVAVRAAATEAAPTPAEETFTYQAEVDRLMDIIVNSLYSNREVFLRELVSNASDALDKARFLAVTDPSIMAGREELEIRISADKDKGTLTIEDSGVGMSREQLLSNLGTIARSGTRKFMEAMAAKGDSNLIGQFGVGFYSAFLVADRVRVQSKAPEDSKQWLWEAAAGSHQYTIREDPVSDLVRGTRITLFLKEDAAEMTDPVRITRLIKQYSQFIAFPIKVYSPKKEPRKVIDEEGTKRKQEAADKKAEEKGEPTKQVEPVMKTEYDEGWDWRLENENKPIWTRSPKDVSETAYNDFFKTTFGEFLDPLAHVHFNVEGTIEFSAIIYLPGMAPFEQQNMMQRSKSIKLYVKRVFISDEFDEDLMPRYLSFVKGVVDSSDLPLNVSREILQESRIVRVIRKQLVRRSIEMMEELAGKEGGEDFKTFWDAFGRQIKYGVVEDTENRERLSKLLRFQSSKSEDGLTSLDQYVSRMKPKQKSIYWMAADSVQSARAAPFVEAMVAKGIEVLYLTEPIDEACITNLGKYGSDKETQYELVDVSKEGISLDEEGEEEKAAAEAAAKEMAPVVDFLKKSLGERVEKVTVSNRLLDSPCALVTSKFGWSANMERIMRSQALGDARAMEYMRGRKIMEINPKHDIIAGIKTLLQEKDEDRARDLAELLYETSLITSGFQVDSPKDYASKVFTLMKIALGYDILSEAEEAQMIQAAQAAAAAPAPAAAEVVAEAPKRPVATPVDAEVVSEEDPWKKM
ncbi:Heat shock protein 90-5, chloroplastic [Pleodorina starrii]|uniref:Heat shock protein 90-5, chloroplastic n=1 Tax=Pleodorina starrii TaxID=330485 RepID=A0A9W6BVY8_9CHLO|nr:Heat shock protein 90-5 [Pleodorina starrii]GLC59237.1 Heat shock protein 90-5, chloroplastic [Pleodorina starrii]GLC74801.1 Heat shock protein 90-5 [Pleodorina starrii]